MSFPDNWLDRGVDPSKLSDETIDTDKWDREDRARMKKEVAPYAAARRKIGEFAKTGGEAMDDIFSVFLKAEPEAKDDRKIRPSFLVNKHILTEAQELDVIHRLRRYTVNDDVQSALSCETVEADLETLFDMTAQQRAQAEQFEKALQALAQANQDQIDLDDLVRQWTEDQDFEPDDCETCQGTGQVPADDADGGEDGEGADQGQQGDQGDQGDQSGDGDGQGQGEGEGQGQGQGAGQPGGSGGTQPCPDCGGSGKQQPGDGQGQGQGQSDQFGPGGSPSNQPNPGGRGRGKHLTPEQRAQMQKWAEMQDELGKRIEQLKAEAAEAGESFDDAMNAQKGHIRGQIQKMLTKAADEAQAANETAMTWGMEPGELQRLPAEERIALAKRLNNERFRRVAQLFGPMRNMMLSEQKRKTVHTPEEIYDITLGNNVGRLLPQEILNLSNPLTRLDFMRRFTEGKLLEYDMQGVEKLAKGAIIFCEDGSGSMSGEREMWAKAVMLCLLHLARIQKRAMHVIHFSSRGQFIHVPFEKPSDFTLERILDAAELFYGGGTDFQTPMKVAMDLLEAEHSATGKVTADVVFVTDDECMVTDDFMRSYLDLMHKVQSTTWGISVSGADRREGALDTMSEGKVATIKDFMSGNEIRGIFRGV